MTTQPIVSFPAPPSAPSCTPTFPLLAPISPRRTCPGRGVGETHSVVLLLGVVGAPRDEDGRAAQFDQRLVVHLLEEWQQALDGPRRACPPCRTPASL